MGHTIRTHQGCYEMPLPVVQKLLIGKDLVAMTEKENLPISSKEIQLSDKEQ